MWMNSQPDSASHNMQNTLKRFLLLLSGSGLSSVEIRRIVETIQYVSEEQIVDAVQYLRHKTRNSVDEVAEAILVGRNRSRRTEGSLRHGSDVPGRVVFLLRSVAGLTVRQAATELLSSMEQQCPDIVNTTKLPRKEGFYVWLQRLSKRVGPSDLLHHAVLVRNKYVHSPMQDWPLREE